MEPVQAINLRIAELVRQQYKSTNRAEKFDLELRIEEARQQRWRLMHPIQERQLQLPYILHHR